MNKRKAFTLVEILVTIAVSAILMVSVGTAFYFVVILNENTIENSSMAYKVRAVRQYIIANKDSIGDTYDDNIIYVEDARSLVDYNPIEDKVIINDSAYVNVDIYTDNGFLKCTITYKLNSRKSTTDELNFVVRKLA